MTPYKPATAAVHAGHGASTTDIPEVPVVTPVHREAMTAFETAADFSDVMGDSRRGYLYSRIRNPNTDELGAAVAELEGADAAHCFASGMAAITAGLDLLAPAGSRVVAARQLYGQAYALLRGRGDTVFCDIGDLDGMARALDGAALLYVETIANPQIDVADLPALARIAHAAGATMLVDNTVATPLGCRPLDHGADLVVHSATKYLNGHSDALAGIVAGRAELIGRDHAARARHRRDPLARLGLPGAARTADAGRAARARRRQRPGGRAHARRAPGDRARALPRPRVRPRPRHRPAGAAAPQRPGVVRRARGRRGGRADDERLPSCACGPRASAGSRPRSRTRPRRATASSPRPNWPTPGSPRAACGCRSASSTPTTWSPTWTRRCGRDRGGRPPPGVVVVAARPGPPVRAQLPRRADLDHHPREEPGVRPGGDRRHRAGGRAADRLRDLRRVDLEGAAGRDARAAAGAVLAQPGPRRDRAGGAAGTRQAGRPAHPREREAGHRADPHPVGSQRVGRADRVDGRPSSSSRRSRRS